MKTFSFYAHISYDKHFRQDIKAPTMLEAFQQWLTDHAPDIAAAEHHDNPVLLSIKEVSA